MANTGGINNSSTESEHSWTWVVKKCSNHFNTRTGTKVVSPSFNIGKYKFEFWWYPGGTTSQTREYIGVRLNMLEPDSALIKFSIHMGYDTIKMFKMTKSEENLEKLLEEPLRSGRTLCNLYAGDSTLVERRVLLDQVLKFSNDELMIKCIIYNLDLPESHRRLQMLDGYEKFVDNEKFSDVKIVVDNKIINAHKVALVNGSPVFAAMFQHNMTENETGVVNIDDIDHDVMIEIVRYMYTGRAERIFHKTKDMLVAADIYALSDLKVLCAKYLCMDLSPDNFFDYLNFAHLHGVDMLTKAAEEFFVSRGSDILDLQNFNESLHNLASDVKGNLIRRVFKKPRLE